MMTKKILISLLGAGLACVALQSPVPVRAQEVQITGPLAGAPAVRKMRLYRKGRVQLQPFLGFTIRDEFSRSLMFGLQANYHFTEWLGLGFWGGFAGVNLDTQLTKEVDSKGVSTDRNRLSLPSRQGFDSQIATLTWAAAIQATFIPLRGKLALFQKVFSDTDFYIFGGAAFIGLEERADVSDGSVCSAPGQACLDTQTARSSRVAIAPTFGAGLTMYFNEYLGLSVEWRGLPFAWNTSGTDESGSPAGDFPDGQIDSDDRRFQFNQMINIGLVFYLPVHARITD